MDIEQETLEFFLSIKGARHLSKRPNLSDYSNLHVKGLVVKKENAPQYHNCTVFFLFFFLYEKEDCDHNLIIHEKICTTFSKCL